MSQDGADLGISADAAMGGAMGDGTPPKIARRTPNEMREYLTTAPSNPDEWGEGGEGYNNSARYCGRLVLELFERHPELLSLPTDGAYEYDRKAPDVQKAWAERRIVREGLDDGIRRVEPSFMETTYGLGLSGFQWGWAVNAARYALDLPPVRNPAIITLG